MTAFPAVWLDEYLQLPFGHKKSGHLLEMPACGIIFRLVAVAVAFSVLTFTFCSSSSVSRSFFNSRSLFNRSYSSSVSGRSSFFSFFTTRAGCESQSDQCNVQQFHCEWIYVIKNGNLTNKR